MNNEETQEIANKIRDSIRGRGKSRTINHLQKQLSDEFANRRGLKESRAMFCRYLRDGDTISVFGTPWPLPNFDHGSMYRDQKTREYVIVSQPYEMNELKEKEDRQYASENGLIVEHISDFPSWWYPEATKLVVWRRKSLRRKALR